MIQHTQQDLLAYRVGLYGYFNLGLEEQVDTTGIYVGKQIKSKQAFEQFRYHAGPGLFPVRNEGERVFIDDVPKRYTFTVTPIIHSLGLAHTNEAEYKDLYNFIRQQGGWLAKSAVATKNLMAADTFMNKAFPGGTTLGGDGVTLFSSSHTTTSATVQSNYGTSAMSTFALEDAIQQINDQRSDRDLLPTHVEGGFKLVTGPRIEALTHRVVKSTQIAGSNANDTNDWLSGRIKQIRVDKFINYGMTTMQNAWALIPAMDKENPLIELFIKDYSFVADELKRTNSIAFYAHFENLFAAPYWRGCFGSKP